MWILGASCKLEQYMYKDVSNIVKRVNGDIKQR